MIGWVSKFTGRTNGLARRHPAAGSLGPWPWAVTRTSQRRGRGWMDRRSCSRCSLAYSQATQPAAQLRSAARSPRVSTFYTGLAAHKFLSRRLLRAQFCLTDQQATLTYRGYWTPIPCKTNLERSSLSRLHQAEN